MSDRLIRIGEMAHGTVRHEDVCWMIEEIERLRELEERTRIFPVRKMARPDLKLLLMELGNRLVIEHGWEPAAGTPALMTAPAESTGLIRALTIQINSRPDMREALTALGYEWPMMETG
jgi:hypothetical protein